MRILLTGDPELPVPPRHYGGIERILADLAAGLRTRGHTVALVAHADSTAPVDAFFPWPGRMSQNLRDNVRNCWTLTQAVRAFRPDILHSFSRLLYMLPLLVQRLPKVMSYQRHPGMRTTRWARRLAMRTLRFTGCSESICRLGRRAGSHWDVIPNFVDLEKYTFKRVVPSTAPLVFLGRVERIKGAHLAIAVARHAGRRLLIAGNYTREGANGDYWRAEIAPYIGRDGIEYIGPVDDRQKDELLGEAAALIVPVQWDEPFGIVFVEALACGTPVISCPRGALPEIIRPGREGFLGETLEELANAVGRIGEIDRGNCRRRVVEAFSAEVVVGRYEGLYTTLVKHRG